MKDGQKSDTFNDMNDYSMDSALATEIFLDISVDSHDGSSDELSASIRKNESESTPPVPAHEESSERKFLRLGRPRKQISEPLQPEKVGKPKSRGRPIKKPRRPPSRVVRRAPRSPDEMQLFSTVIFAVLRMRVPVPVHFIQNLIGCQEEDPAAFSSRLQANLISHRTQNDLKFEWLESASSPLLDRLEAVNESGSSIHIRDSIDESDLPCVLLLAVKEERVIEVASRFSSTQRNTRSKQKIFRGMGSRVMESPNLASRFASYVDPTRCGEHAPGLIDELVSTAGGPGMTYSSALSYEILHHLDFSPSHIIWEEWFRRAREKCDSIQELFSSLSNTSQNGTCISVDFGSSHFFQWSWLHQAAECGNLALVEHLVEVQDFPLEIEFEGDAFTPTPLEVALLCGRDAIFEYLWGKLEHLRPEEMRRRRVRSSCLNSILRRIIFNNFTVIFQERDLNIRYVRADVGDLPLDVPFFTFAFILQRWSIVSFLAAGRSSFHEDHLTFHAPLSPNYENRWVRFHFWDALILFVSDYPGQILEFVHEIDFPMSREVSSLNLLLPEFAFLLGNDCVTLIMLHLYLRRMEGMRLVGSLGAHELSRDEKEERNQRINAVLEQTIADLNFRKWDEARASRILLAAIDSFQFPD